MLMLTLEKLNNHFMLVEVLLLLQVILLDLLIFIKNMDNFLYQIF